MSRIGNRILSIPEAVSVKVLADNTVAVKGPKGTLTKHFNPAIKITVTEQGIKVTRSSDLKRIKQLHGTTNSLLASMLIGVKTGFEKKLILQGVGYRAKMVGQHIALSLGFSHIINYVSPFSGVVLSSPRPTLIVVNGSDKQQVGEVAAQIRALRPPEPYKGKGIRYADETIIRKEGKSAGK